MYRQCSQKAWGLMAHRGWARLLLDRARGLIIHGPAHRGANGADEDDQDGHLLLLLPTRVEELLRCLGVRSPCYCCLDPIPLTEGGATTKNTSGHFLASLVFTHTGHRPQAGEGAREIASTVACGIQ